MYNKDLNEEQLQAVLNGDGPALVVAGAGSGKTRVLTYRVMYLINEMKIHPYNILAITFTNKAAKEMLDRIVSKIGAIPSLWMCTFHSMCVRILRQDIELLGYNKNFSIYSEIDTDKVLKRIISSLNLNSDIRAAAREEISKAKERALDPMQYKKTTNFNDVFSEIYLRYEQELQDSNALDFDDLLLKTLRLFLLFPDILRKYQERFRYIHIDEFQDTNKIQYALIKMLGYLHRNVYAVGDEDQSIYGWRGADVHNFKEFQKDFPEYKVFKLERNYRSTSNILSFANRLIDNNRDRIKKELWTEREEGYKVEYKCLDSDREECRYVISRITALISEAYRYNDYAILVRANSLTRLFEEALNLYGYPYKVYGGYKFYERKEIKDVIAYLRIIANPKDNEAILRVINFPKRGIGDKAIASLIEYCEINGLKLIDGILNISSTKLNAAIINRISLFKEIITNLMKASCELNLRDLIFHVIRITGIEEVYNSIEDRDRKENVEELVGSIVQYHEANPLATVSDYLQSVSLMSDTDDIASGDYITIATVHSAKGLEFKCVFVVGLEEGIFPSSLTIDRSDSLEEERRVMYVAMTRAKDRLILTGAASRFRYNEMKYMMPSRFIEEMGIVIERRKYFSDYDSHGYYPQRSSQSQYIPSTLNNKVAKDLSMYSDGVKVIHNRFGEGRIIEMKGGNIALIEFIGLGVKEFDLSIAPIKISGE